MKKKPVTPSTDPAFRLTNLTSYFSEPSPNPMVAVEGVNSIVRHVNTAFLRLAGVDRADLIGQPYAMAVPEGSTNGCKSLLDRVYRTGTHELLAEQKHGNTTPTYWSYAVWAILGKDEHPVGVMIQVADSTEIAVFRGQSVAMNESLLLNVIRQQELADASEAMNARLQAAIKEKEYFIAVLSHEMRTPLAPVLIAAALLKEDQQLDAETRGLMQMIHRNIMHEARLIDDLLDMTRMEQGKLTLDCCPIDLRQVVRWAVEGCKEAMDSAGLVMEIDAGSQTQMVDADAGRLQQVISNLLRNAIKFTPRGGHILVSCRRDADSSVAEVSDNGIGVDPDFLPRMFSAFEQDKTDNRMPGLGLGLAICKTIVELHGGNITATSDGKGRGATFTVDLPRLIHSLPSSVKTQPYAPSRDKSLRILLVEDNVDTARTMQLLLSADGCKVQWAADVAAAMNLSESENFDLLVSDLGLPDGSGWDLMQALRDRGSTLPGIVCSGYGSDQDIAKSLQTGFFAHLVKPISRQSLRDAMASVE